MAVGPFNPQPILFYNSLSPASSEFGFGWNNLFKQSIATSATTAVSITKGSSTVLRYPVSGSTFTPPGGVQNSLVKNADGTYTETQPNGTALKYNTSGALATVKNAAGATWSMSYSSGRITKIADPAGGTTSLAYNASNKLKRIVDPSGRITSFTVNASGDLARWQMPDSTVYTCLYDSNHRLRAHVDGARSDARLRLERPRQGDDRPRRQPHLAHLEQFEKEAIEERQSKTSTLFVATTD